MDMIIYEYVCTYGYLAVAGCQSSLANYNPRHAVRLVVNRALVFYPATRFIADTVGGYRSERWLDPVVAMVALWK